MAQNRTEVGQLSARGGNEDDADLAHPGNDLVQPGRNTAVTVNEGPVHVCDDEAQVDLSGKWGKEFWFKRKTLHATIFSRLVPRCGEDGAATTGACFSTKENRRPSQRWLVFLEPQLSALARRRRVTRKAPVPIRPAATTATATLGPVVARLDFVGV